MRNKAMERKLAAGDAIDVSKCERTKDGDYVLTSSIAICIDIPTGPGADLCDAEDETWIWSVGRHKETGVILASTSSKFYTAEDPAAPYKCIWLR